MGNCNQFCKIQQNQIYNTTLNNNNQLNSNLNLIEAPYLKLNQIIQSSHPYSDYQKLASLGQGAYGNVFLVKQKKNSKLYAMKIVKKNRIAQNEKIIECTLLEKKILLECDSPFIVKLRRSFQTQKKLYIIMEFMPNGDLYSLLQKQKKFNEHVTRFIIAEVILGIEYLHLKQNSMYRDLKPENILISKSGHIKLADFGLAKQFASEEDKENAFLGTPYYLAPEVILGKPYDKSIDLWTLGILMYELLVGRPPFLPKENYDQQEMYKEIVRNQPIFESELFSIQALDLIKQLLQNEPQKRLGYNNFNNIKNHEFFLKIQWDKISKKLIESPLLPFLAKKPSRQYRPKSIYESPVKNKDFTVTIPNFSYTRDESLNL